MQAQAPCQAAALGTITDNLLIYRELFGSCSVSGMPHRRDFAEPSEGQWRQSTVASAKLGPGRALPTSTMPPIVDRGSATIARFPNLGSPRSARTPCGRESSCYCSSPRPYRPSRRWHGPTGATKSWMISASGPTRASHSSEATSSARPSAISTCPTFWPRTSESCSSWTSRTIRLWSIARIDISRP